MSTCAISHLSDLTSGFGPKQLHFRMAASPWGQFVEANTLKNLPPGFPVVYNRTGRCDPRVVVQMLSDNQLDQLKPVAFVVLAFRGDNFDKMLIEAEAWTFAGVPVLIVLPDHDRLPAKIDHEHFVEANCRHLFVPTSDGRWRPLDEISEVIRREMVDNRLVVVADEEEAMTRFLQPALTKET